MKRLATGIGFLVIGAVAYVSVVWLFVAAQTAYEDYVFD